MKYTINVYPLEKPISNIRANVSIVFDDIVCVRGIRICEDSNERLFLDLPKRSLSGNRDASTRLIVAPTEEFADELCTNVINTYKDGKGTCNVDDDVDETRYEINTVKCSSGNCLGMVNLTIEDCIKINGFSVVNGENGLFLSNPAIKTKNNSYYDIAYPMTADFKEHILKNSLNMLEEKVEDDKHTKSLKAELQKEEDNLNMVKEFMKETYDKMRGDLPEDAEKMYLETLGLCVYSEFEVNEKISKIKKELAAKAKNSTRASRR